MESIPLVDFNNLPNSISEFEFSQFERSVESRIQDSIRQVGEGLRRRIPWKFTEAYEPLVGSTVESAAGGSIVGAGTAAVGSVGAGVAGATAGVGTVGGVIVGGAVVGGLLGNILTRGRGATLPGHHFIGPGNPVDTAVPVDTDDQIAKEHDIAYGKVQNAGDIVKADEEAIAKFREDFDTHGNWHSKLGELGLRAKQGVEKLTGPLYPSLPGTSKTIRA